MTFDAEGKKDLEIWKEYDRARKSGNRMKARKKRRELYEQMKGIVHKKTNKFHYSGVPMVNVESKGREQFRKAIDNFDPNRGTKLSTHVTNYLKDVSGHVRKFKDVAKIPDHRTRAIDQYTKAKSNLEVKKGREPSMQEMAEEMRWGRSEVEKMEEELKRDELSSAGLQQAGLSLDDDQDARTKETLDLVYMSLEGEEQAVMEYLLGYGGKPKLDTGKEVGQALNMSPSKVSRIRKKIAEKIEKYNR